MDLYIDRDELIRGLARAQGIVERRATNPVLGNVLLSARGDRLRMTASDTMLWLVADYPTRIEEEGELSVDASTFFQIARTLTQPTVHVQQIGGNRLHISCGSAEFKVPGLAPEDYPPLPTRDERTALTVAGSDLRRMIEETLFSVSPDDNRYGLNGAHMEEITGDDGEARLRLVTTDGSRLSWSECTYEGEFAMGRRMLLPRKALGELRKLIESDAKGEGASWSIAFGERSATFSSGSLTFLVRLVDGEFPDYRQVVPNGFKRQVSIDRSLFLGALKRAGIMASDRNHSVHFTFEADRLVLTAQNADSGDVREEIPAELEGEPLSTGFNVRYFQDILSATTGANLRLELGEALDPCIVRTPDRTDCLFVVMPMRLD
jgi:DNA polymerase III subunit beta